MTFRNVGFAYILIMVLSLFNRYITTTELQQLTLTLFQLVLYALAFMGVLLLYVKHSDIKRTWMMNLIFVFAVIQVITGFLGEWYIYTDNYIGLGIIYAVGLLPSSVVSISGLVYTYKFASYIESKLILTYVYLSVAFIFIPFVGSAIFGPIIQDSILITTYQNTLMVVSNLIELIFIYFLLTFKGHA
jgi:hypothetical protein